MTTGTGAQAASPAPRQGPPGACPGGVTSPARVRRERAQAASPAPAMVRRERAQAASPGRRRYPGGSPGHRAVSGMALRARRFSGGLPGGAVSGVACLPGGRCPGFACWAGRCPGVRLLGGARPGCLVGGAVSGMALRAGRLSWGSPGRPEPATRPPGRLNPMCPALPVFGGGHDVGSWWMWRRLTPWPTAWSATGSPFLKLLTDSA